MSAMEIYRKLGFSRDTIKLVLNRNSPVGGIRKGQVEKVLDHPVDFELPYEPEEVSRALNFGEPFLLTNPDMEISTKIQDMAYLLSHDIHKNLPPAAPTDLWKRVTDRLEGRKS